MVFLLNAVLKDFKKIGIQTIRKETDEKAKFLYTTLEKNKRYEIFVKNKQFRSPTVIVAKVHKGSKPLTERLKKKGIILGSGYGETKATHIRIGNFPAHSFATVKKLASLL